MKTTLFAPGLVGPLVCAALGVAIVAVACAHAKPPPPVEPQVTETVADAGVEEEAPPKALFERLGGKEGVAKVVDSFLQNAQIDPKLKSAFGKTSGARAERFKTNMVDLICSQTGGDCTYGGKDMKQAHVGMKITEDQWNAFVADLTLALDEHKVSEQDKSELFLVFAKMKDDVVAAKKKGDAKKP
jgi:hemoglobin